MATRLSIIYEIDTWFTYIPIPAATRSATSNASKVGSVNSITVSLDAATSVAKTGGEVTSEAEDGVGTDSNTTSQRNATSNVWDESDV